MVKGRRKSLSHRPERKPRGTIQASHVVAAVWLILGPFSVNAQIGLEQIYKEAQAARVHGDLPAAEQKYLEVIRRAPGMASAYHNLGIVYFQERKYQQATVTLEKATRLDPHLAQAHAMLGLTYYELYQPEKAVAAFKTALRLNPSDTNARLFLGKSQLQERDYRAAAETLEKLAESKPDDPDMLYSLSLAYMKLMLGGVNRLGKVAPGSCEFFLLLAQDAEARNDDEAAIKNYREALRLKPEAVGAHYALGSAYARNGRYDDAAREFRQELAIDPNDTLALWKLGELLLRTDPREARQVLEKAVGLDPNFPQAVLAYGRALARLEETEKAIEQFQRVVRLAPEEDSVHYQLAAAYRRLGRGEEAKAQLARFEELARKKSDRRQEAARQLIELSRGAQAAGVEPEPGFSPAREPAHH